MLPAILRFAAWEASLFAAAIALAWRLGLYSTTDGERDSAEKWLAVLALQLTLESSLAALLSFTRMNSPAAYWASAAVCGVGALVAGRAAFSWLAGPGGRSRGHPTERLNEHPGARPGDRGGEPIGRLHFALLAALVVPLLCLAFRPVEEIDSINYLHYLIDWMGNRATPYTFATNYVAFWELSFLPTWMVTGVDGFFPLLALKSLILLALAAWLVGRELGLRGPLLLWTVATSLTLRHLWFESSGVGTLKNDALHGVGFLLLTLAMLRGGGSVFAAAMGASFAAVKYTGIFLAALAVAALAVKGRLKRRDARGALWAYAAGVALFMGTSGHYYLRTLLEHGSPFYPFQINFGPIHLPGTADLSATSILYSLHDPRLWRALFWPAGGVSPAGLLFPLTLAAVLLLGCWRCARAAWSWLRRRAAPGPLDWAAAAILCGWLLYFRSVFSASAQIGGGDLSFVLNSLNSIRYVDGVLAASDLWLVALAGRALAVPLIAVQIVSRLLILYTRIPADLFPPLAMAAAAVLAAAAVMALGHRAAWVAAAALLVASPYVVQRNRTRWTTYWDALKPRLESVRDQGLAVLAMPDGGYFAAHVVAAGNPVHPAVRAWLPEELEALAPAARPAYLAVMPTPGSEVGARWREVYGARLQAWGYDPSDQTAMGGLFHRRF